MTDKEAEVWAKLDGSIEDKIMNYYLTKNDLDRFMIQADIFRMRNRVRFLADLCADIPDEDSVCDLHTHSLYSDGTLTPTEIVQLAEEVDCSAVALCDHNTVDGLDEFLEAGRKYGVFAVPGVEFTCGYKGKDVHILALFVRTKSFDKIKRYVAKSHVLKDKSNRILIENLAKDGYILDYEKIKADSPEAHVNRAHIAEALKEKGYVSSSDEAFDTLLKPGNKYYVPPERRGVAETVEFIESIRAVSVFAHPLVSLSYEEVDELLPVLKEKGLTGMETVYSLYDEETTAKAKALAEKYDLLESGGSDFHGGRKPGIDLVKGKGNLHIPFEFFSKLLDEALKK